MITDRNFSCIAAPEEYALYWYRDNSITPVSIAPTIHPYRSVYDCDRDRAMYCSAFRRLASKTQVFNSRSGDNLRTRLTHTLEVAQIGRTIARRLNLSESLTEAIALAHDVGHTPFGHVGERALNAFSIGADEVQKGKKSLIPVKDYGFKHNLQSVRVLADFSSGVKFSNQLLYGVREHSKRYWKKEQDTAFYNQYDSYCSYVDLKTGTHNPAWTFEAFIVKWADGIAQRHHDIEDAYHQNIMSPKDIVDKVRPLAQILNDENIAKKLERLQEEESKLQRKNQPIQSQFAHTLSSFLVDAYVTTIIGEFNRVLLLFCNKQNIEERDDFLNKYLSIEETEIQTLMSLKGTKLAEIDDAFGDELRHSILDSYEVQKMDGKGANIINTLVRAYLSNPQLLPNQYINQLMKREIPRFLSIEDQDRVFSRVRSIVGNCYTANVNMWKDYESREALRIIMQKIDNKCTIQTDSIIYPALLRTIFDYVSGMTDDFAAMQYNDLY